MIVLVVSCTGSYILKRYLYESHCLHLTKHKVPIMASGRPPTYLWWIQMSTHLWWSQQEIDPWQIDTTAQFILGFHVLAITGLKPSILLQPLTYQHQIIVDYRRGEFAH
jgi:hypothetical protein